MTILERKRILRCRKFVDFYRASHSEMHKGIKRKNAHLEMLDILKLRLKKEGFSMQEFYNANKLMNLQQMGFRNKVDYKKALIGNPKLSHIFIK